MTRAREVVAGLRRMISSRSVRDVNKVALGLATLVVFAGMVGVTFAIGALSLFSERYRVTAVFENSGGLKIGAAVRVAGIDVGKVESVTGDYATGQVLITFEVDRGVDLGPTTMAEIGTTTFLGGDYLKLTNTQGRPSIEDLPDDERRIPLERTRVAFTLLSDLTALTESAQQIDPTAINDVLNDIGSTITNNIDDIPELVADLERLGTTLVTREDEFEQLIINGVQVAATLENRDQQLVQLIDQAFNLLDALNSRRDQLAALLGSGSDAVNRLAAVITEKRAQFESILADLHTTTQGIERSLPDLNAGLAYAGQIATELANVIGTSADGTGYFNVMATGASAISLTNMACIFDVLLAVPDPCHQGPG